MPDPGPAVQALAELGIPGADRRCATRPSFAARTPLWGKSCAGGVRGSVLVSWTLAGRAGARRRADRGVRLLDRARGAGRRCATSARALSLRAALEPGLARGCAARRGAPGEA